MAPPAILQGGLSENPVSGVIPKPSRVWGSTAGSPTDLELELLLPPAIGRWLCHISPTAKLHKFQLCQVLERLSVHIMNRLTYSKKLDVLVTSVYLCALCLSQPESISDSNA